MPYYDCNVRVISTSTTLLFAGNDFKAGDLGPGTIVGSAAFNLFVIIALCIYIIPTGEVRQIKHLRVFFVTAAWSIIAYVWLYLIVARLSPGVITVSILSVAVSD